MSRSGYSDDCDGWDLIRWRGAVTSAIKGQRGQQFLRELAAAMDAMPDKRLIADELQADGAFCTLGVMGATRGIDMANLDPYDRESVAGIFNVAPALAAEIMFENDQDFYWKKEAPEARWQRMRQWVGSKIKESTPLVPGKAGR